MYTVADYGRMIADEVRMNAYVEAMKRTIRPGDVVVDLGAGAGIMTLWACRLGARRVYAIESNPAVELARRACKRNGVSDRVAIFEALSTDVTLPEPADVIVSDLRGVLPMYGAHFETVADARARFLRPGGTLIPKVDSLQVALVQAPELHERLYDPFRTSDFDLTDALEVMRNTFSARSVDVGPEGLLSEPAEWARVVYGESPPAVFAGQVKLRVTRKGTAHALALWFDASLIEGVGFSNRPGTALVYGRTFAPLPEAVDVEAGDVFDVQLFARRNAEDYVWGWTTTVRSTTGASRVFRQTSLGEAFTWPHREDDRVLRPGPRGQLARRALDLMDGTRTVAEIARHLGEVTPTDASALALPASESAAFVRRLGRMVCS